MGKCRRLRYFLKMPEASSAKFSLTSRHNQVVLQDPVAESTMEHGKTHRRTQSKSSSWGEGVKITKKIFENFMPYEAQEESVEEVAKAFHDRNQHFLKSASSTQKPPIMIPLEPLSQSRKPPNRPDLPPPTPSAGLSSGRGYLKSIGSDNWSENSKSTPARSRNDSKASSTTLGSATSREFSVEPSPRLPPSGRKASSLEVMLTGRLLSRAYNNKAREAAKESAVSYSDGTESLGTSISSQTTRTDGRSTGYSGDDSLSLVSSEFSLSHSGDSTIGSRSHDRATRKKEKVKILLEKEKKYVQRYFDELQRERQTLLSQWREEFNSDNAGREHGFVGILRTAYDKCVSNCLDPFWKFLSYVEVFISNIPLTIGAVGLCWVTQGTIWFKFTEENIDSCTTVHFYSPMCTYPEFPGCFECDLSNPLYRTAVTFHYFCHCVAFACCLLFLAKCALAWRVVADELSNPTTSTPCGVVCITLICVAAGRGPIGEAVVLITSVFHTLLSFWFLYIAIHEFRLWPDPGWFPNTVGIAYAAVKTWLYFPIAGLIIMVLCMLYLFGTFFIAIYRAYYNHKIAAPVCFISLSAPSITMYAMTIMAQPSPEGEVMLEHSDAITRRFDEIHRHLYLPVQHFMMILSLLGFVSSLHCLWTRWPTFKEKPFSPAHIAFIFPILSHTNAVQAYRSGFNSFSTEPVGSPFKLALFNYWFLCLVIGTALNFIFTYKYVVRLPKWTKLDVAFMDEDIPPSPNNTMVHEMLVEEQGAHECLNQTFTSPAVLQANEAGTLVRVRRGTEDYENYGPYVRTRNVSSLGFDLTLTEEELRRERAELLDWVAKNAPRTRNRTLSIPQMFKLRSGSKDHDVYGTFHAGEAAAAAPGTAPARHKRSFTWGSWV